MPGNFYSERISHLSKSPPQIAMWQANFNSEPFCNNADTVSVLAHNHSLIFQQIFTEGIQVPGTVLHSSVGPGARRQRSLFSSGTHSAKEGKHRR